MEKQKNYAREYYMATYEDYSALEFSLDFCSDVREYMIDRYQIPENEIEILWLEPEDINKNLKLIYINLPKDPYYGQEDLKEIELVSHCVIRHKELIYDCIIEEPLFLREYKNKVFEAGQNISVETQFDINNDTGIKTII